MPKQVGEKIKSLNVYLTRGLREMIGRGSGELNGIMPFRDEAVPLWDCARTKLAQLVFF